MMLARLSCEIRSCQNLTVYDSLESGAQVIIADERLADALEARQSVKCLDGL